LDSNKADDLVQQVWLSALNSKAPPRPGTDLRPWLKVVTRNALSQFHRSDVRRTTRERKDPKSELLVEASFSQQRERTAILEKLVGEMEEPYQSILRLRFYEELNLRGIAKRQGITYKMAKTRLRRALDQLRGMLDRRYGSREAWGILLLPLCPVGMAPKGGATASVSAKWAYGLCASVLLFLPAFVAISSGGGPTTSKGERFAALDQKGAQSAAAESQLPSADKMLIPDQEAAEAAFVQTQRTEPFESTEDSGNPGSLSKSESSPSGGKRGKIQGTFRGAIKDLRPIPIPWKRRSSLDPHQGPWPDSTNKAGNQPSSDLIIPWADLQAH